MADEENKFRDSLIISFALLAVLWVIQFLQYYHVYDFTRFANHPRHWEGLLGIVFSPFVHAPHDFKHLLSNSLPLLVLLVVLLNAYREVALKVWLFIQFVSGTMVWLFAPANTYHIGISGVIYGIASFLIASGLFRSNRQSVAISLFVTLVYGGMVLGFIPTQGVSWQSHLFGSLSGVFIAFVFRKRFLPPPTEIEMEQREVYKHFFEEYPDEEPTASSQPPD